MAIVHVSTVMGICAGAVLVPVTGGTDSPALDYLWFVVVYAAVFCTPRQAIAYWLGCALVHASPLLYDGHATEGNLARELLVVASRAASAARGGTAAPTYGVASEPYASGRRVVRNGNRSSQSRR
jgi:hypothetical protein